MNNTRDIEIPKTNDTANARRSKVSSINSGKRINTQTPHTSDIMDLQNQIDEVRQMAIDLYRELGYTKHWSKDWKRTKKTPNASFNKQLRV